MRYAVFSLLVLASTGCVGKGKYNALKQDYDTIVTKKSETDAKLKRCKEGMVEMHKASNN